MWADESAGSSFLVSDRRVSSQLDEERRATFGSATSLSTSWTNALPTIPPDESTFLTKGTASRTRRVNERSGFLIRALNARIGQSLSRRETGRLNNTPLPRGSRLRHSRQSIRDGPPQETNRR